MLMGEYDEIDKKKKSQKKKKNPSHFRGLATHLSVRFLFVHEE
jgi:hypothetical protein